MNYSRRHLEFLGEPLGDSVTRIEANRTVYGAGGGGGPSNVTQTTTNIPNWLRPQTEATIGAAMQQLFQTTPVTDAKGRTTYQITGMRPYVPYSANPSDYVAGFSPLQEQVMANAANLQVPMQFQQATGLVTPSGGGAVSTVPQAQRYGGLGALYGAQGADIGRLALQERGFGADVGQQARGYAEQAAMVGPEYMAMATSPAAMQAFMSPYSQNVIQAQMLEAQRQADIASTQRGAQFARAGAYGGARQAIENAEAQRNLAGLKNQIVAQGLQNAFQQAQQAQQFGTSARIQGLSGAQAGLGTALQGGQLGLSGIGQAIAGQQAGMQGAGVGLQGISGAQSGYGLANQIAQTLGTLGGQQLGAQTGILNLQNQIGAMQQQQEQNIINQAISNFSQAQQYPMQQINAMNALLRGYAIPGQTTTQYQAPPSTASQLGALGLGAYGISQLAGAGRKAGGQIKTTGIDQLALRRALKGGKA